MTLLLPDFVEKQLAAGQITTEVIVFGVILLCLVVGLIFLAVGALTLLAIKLGSTLWGVPARSHLWVAALIAPVACALLLPLLLVPAGLRLLKAVPVDLDISIPSAMAEVDEALSALPPGVAAFQVPAQVRQYDTFTVTLAVATDALAAAARQTRPPQAAAEADPTWTSILTTQAMKPSLSSLDFELDEREGAVQLLTSRQTTRWQWQAKGLLPGEGRIKVKLFAILDPDAASPQQTSAGKVTGQRLVFEQTAFIDVRVNPSGIASRHAEWFATYALIPLLASFGGFLAATGLFKRRRRTASARSSARQRSSEADGDA
jgi:hypothetical protein